MNVLYKAMRHSFWKKYLNLQNIPMYLVIFLLHEFIYLLFPAELIVDINSQIFLSMSDMQECFLQQYFSLDYKM